MRVRVRISKAIAVLSVLATGQLPIAAARLRRPGGRGLALQTLEPGAFRVISQALTVNVVFVGFDGPEFSINHEDFLAALPGTYSSIHRSQNFYGRRESTGNRFDFTYNVVSAGADYADKVFESLSLLASPHPRTLEQDAYNAQPGRFETVGQNHWIDAPSVEAWLGRHPPPGVDTSTYTVYFINWYGREDFKFHVYTKTNYPDPDTGVNFGEVRSSRKIVAWGGAAGDADGGEPLRRVWFYDFSAGPEAWGGTYDISNADFDRDGAPDYRIPPIWDYGNPNGYRPFDDLTGDAARLVRFVAINLLFTTSPLYKPAVSPPDLPGSVNIDLSFFQGDGTSNALDYIKPAAVIEALGKLQRHVEFTADNAEFRFDARIRQVIYCFTFGPSCYGNKLDGISFGDLFLYVDSHLLQYLDGEANYEVPVFGFNLPSELTTNLLGFADDNWSDGTQSYVFEFISPLIRNAGYGFTSTTTHEVGHHLGMSHPHDGYDSELDMDYGPTGPTYYAWAGDESDTIMHYLDLSPGFSQFDRDNMDRWMTAGYINQANAVLANIMKSPLRGRVAAELQEADSDATQALGRYSTMDYGGAVACAKKAYDKVRRAAAAINVQIEPQSWQADYKAKGQSSVFVDRVDYLHRLAP
jgi:hypothetical protein